MKKWVWAVFIFVSLSSFGQTGSEIILFDLKMRNGQVELSNAANITNHKGYDNQPFFHPSKPIIYYASFDDSSRSDIKFYNYKTGKTTNLTTTRDREYSPTITPDHKFISCIIQRDNGSQDLGMYPIAGGQPVVLINHLKIGYHAWIDNKRLLLFVLGDSNTNTLHYYNLQTKKDSSLCNNIGRSLHLIPGQAAMSFVQKVSEKESLVKRMDLVTGVISTLTSTLPGQDHLTWLQNNILLMGHGKTLFSFHVGIDKEWQPVTTKGDIFLLKEITRLSTTADNTKLAVVVRE